MHDRDRSNEPPTLGIFGAISALVLCCFIVGILTYSNGQEAERRDKTPAAYSEAAKSKAQQDCVGLEPDAMFECIYEKVESSQQQAHDEQDLTAQQKSANGTMITAALAFLGLAVSAVGIGLVYTTYAEARKANEIALEIGQAQTRAYLSLESCEVIIQHQGPPLLKFSVANKGASPSTDGLFTLIPSISHVANKANADGGRFTVIDCTKSEYHIGSLAPGEIRKDLLVAFSPKLDEISEIAKLGDFSLQPSSFFGVSADFFLKWSDVFSTKCDSSGFIVSRNFIPGKAGTGFASIGQAEFRTSVYDTAAWFKKRRENQEQK